MNGTIKYQEKWYKFEQKPVQYLLGLKIANSIWQKSGKMKHTLTYNGIQSGVWYHIWYHTINRMPNMQNGMYLQKISKLTNRLLVMYPIKWPED